MSVSTFKQNMLSYMQNQSGIKSFDDFAEKFTSEYDFLIKSGYQGINGNKIISGNKDAMLVAAKNACRKALQKKEGTHDFVNDLGESTRQYWINATFVVGIPPLLPAIATIGNVILNSAVVSNIGTWTPQPPTLPNTDSNILLDSLISGIKLHLTTVSGFYFPTSIYPTFPTPLPLPAVLPFFGYSIVGSAVPKSPTPNVENNLVSDLINKVLELVDDLTNKEKEDIQQELDNANNILADNTLSEEERGTAEEFSSRASQMLSNGKHESAPVYFSEEELEAIDNLQDEDFKCKIGAEIIRNARKDLEICEYKNRNYGGFGPGEQKDAPGRIDEMFDNIPLDNRGQVSKTGSGFFWCAAAVTTWWKDAGSQVPSKRRALCNEWLEWSQKNGYFSNVPKQGAAILYRGSRKPGAVHIGIVESIVKGVGVNTIEGNTGGGSKFADNGGGCYRKLAKFNKGNIIGFVNPPECE